MKSYYKVANEHKALPMAVPKHPHREINNSATNFADSLLDRIVNRSIDLFVTTEPQIGSETSCC